METRARLITQTWGGQESNSEPLGTREWLIGDSTAAPLDQQNNLDWKVVDEPTDTDANMVKTERNTLVVCLFV